MSGVRSRLRCKWCGREESVDMLRKRHGPKAPYCIGARTWRDAQEHGFSRPGRDEAVLDRAGLLTWRPLWIWWDEDAGHDAKGNRILARQEMVTYESFAPLWAIRLARRLVDDQVLVRKIGGVFVRMEERTGLKEARKLSAQGLYGGLPRQKGGKFEKAMLDVSFRAKILKTLSASAMSREMAEDDLEAVALIVRDS